MPNIPQIKVGNITYKLKDAELQEHVKSTLSNYHQMTNLINPTNIEDGCYYSSQYLNKQTNAGYSTTGQIPVIEKEKYTVSKWFSPVFTWLLGSSWNRFTEIVTDAVTNADGSVTFTIPNNITQIAISFESPTATTKMFVRGSMIPPKFVSYGSYLVVIDDLELEKKSVSQDKLSDHLSNDVNLFEDMNVEILENILDVSTIDNGHFYSSQYLNKGDNSGYSTYDPADVVPGKTYTASPKIDTYFSWIYANNLWVRLSENVTETINPDGSHTFTIPQNATKIAVSVITTQRTSMIVNGESLPSKYIEGGTKYVIIPNLIIPEQNDTITYFYVNKAYTSSDEGFGETKFNSIIDAVDAVQDPSEDNRYEIIVKAGVSAENPEVYDEWNTRFGGHAPDEDAYVGVLVPRYTTIRSDQPNHPNFTVLYFDGHAGISDTMTYNDAYKKCLFHFSGKTFDAKVRGFTLRSKNTRYCIHPESNVDAFMLNWYIEDCVFDWLGDEYASETGWGGHAVGIGIGCGGTGHISRCKWTTPPNNWCGGIAGHTNGWNQYVPKPALVPGAKLIIEDCDFNGYHVGLSDSATEGVADLNSILKFINCTNLKRVDVNGNWVVVMEATVETEPNS